MDVFPDGTMVRLKNRERGTYLFADEDGASVSLSHHRAAPNAAWEVRVEKTLWDLHFNTLLLRSAASGRFLALAPDHRGRRVAQRVYEEGAHPGAFMWRPVRTEHGRDDGEFVILLHVLGLAVRAEDGRIDGVAADDLDNVCDGMHWSAEVQADPLRPALPHLPPPEGGEEEEGGDDPEADVDGANHNQQAVADADAEAAADGNGGVALQADQNSPQRQAARLYGKLEDLYHLMERLYEDAREHHHAIHHIEDEAKEIGDWSGVQKALRPRYQSLDKIERSYDYQVRLATDLRLELVRLGFPPLEEPDHLRHPNNLRR